MTIAELSYLVMGLLVWKVSASRFYWYVNSSLECAFVRNVLIATTMTTTELAVKISSAIMLIQMVVLLGEQTASTYPSRLRNLLGVYIRTDNFMLSAFTSTDRSTKSWQSLFEATKPSYRNICVTRSTSAGRSTRIFNFGKMNTVPISKGTGLNTAPTIPW